MASVIQNQASPAGYLSQREVEDRDAALYHEHKAASEAATRILDQARALLGRPYMAECAMSDWVESKPAPPAIEVWFTFDERSWEGVAEKLEALLAIVRKECA